MGDQMKEETDNNNNSNNSEVEVHDGGQQKRPTLRRQVSIWAQARQSAFGAILCILCAFAYSTNGFLAKLLMSSGAASPYFVTFARQFFMVAYIVPVSTFFSVKLANSPPLNKHWKAITIRCIFGSGSLIYFLGLSFASLAEVGVIFAASVPIFASIFARIFIGERFRYTDIFFMLATAAGVALILRPPFIFPPELAQGESDGETMTNRLIGCGCSALSALCHSIAYIGARSCSKDVHYSALVFWNCLVGLVVSFSVMAALDGYQSPCDSVNRVLVVVSAVCAMFGQAATTLSVRYISPVITSLSSSVELAFLFVFQTTILGQFPHYCSIIGSSIIITAMVILVGRSWIIDKIKQNENAKDSHSVFAPTSKHYKVLNILTK